jgi:hypothetical protein
MGRGFEPHDLEVGGLGFGVILDKTAPVGIEPTARPRADLNRDRWIQSPEC